MSPALLTYVLVTSTIVTLPIVVVVVIGERWIGRTVGCAMIALAYAAAAGYSLWHIEWFDVWRHGVPPIETLAPYAGYMVAFGFVGWLIGSGIMTQAARARGPAVEKQD